MKKRYPDIPTAFIQTMRDTAMESVKSAKAKGGKKPRKKKHSALRYDKRTLTLRGQQLTLSCIGKRERVILRVPDYCKEIFDTWKLKGATLVYLVRKKQFVIKLVYEKEAPPQRNKGTVIGLDRGTRHCVVTSEGTFFSNKKVRAVQRRQLHNRKTAQAKGTPSARQRLKALSGKEKRFSRDVNHQITKNLANFEGVQTFVLEDLKGIRKQKRGKKLNKHISSWPFFQFASFLEYKCEATGKKVVYVDPRYTSQKCSRCKMISKRNRRKSKYYCSNCGLRLHADWNAAINVRDEYLISSTQVVSEEQAVVNQPYVTIV